MKKFLPGVFILILYLYLTLISFRFSQPAFADSCSGDFTIDSCTNPAPANNTNTCSEVTDVNPVCEFSSDQDFDSVDFFAIGNCSNHDVVDVSGEYIDGRHHWRAHFGVLSNYVNRNFDVVAVGKLGSTTCTSDTYSVIGGNAPPPPCPYTEIKTSFIRENVPGIGEVKRNDMTLVVGQRADIISEGKKPDGSWEAFSSGGGDDGIIYRIEQTESDSEDVGGGYDPGFQPYGLDTTENTTFGGERAFNYSGHYTVTATSTNPNCTSLSPGIAELTVMGCPYTSTTVQTAPIDIYHPLNPSYYEEYPDTGKGFCSYATADGSCTDGDLPLKVKSGSLLTHTNKVLRFKVLHFNSSSGSFVDFARDGNIIVNGPGGDETCYARTDGAPVSGYECIGNSSGYVNFRTNPDWTTTAALQSGGLTKDDYEVMTTTNVKNPQTNETIEVSTPACVDHDLIHVDACLYDSTQAYLRKYADVSGLGYDNTIAVNKGDGVFFAGFHDFPDPKEIDLSDIIYPFNTRKYLSGPYGFKKDYLSSDNPSYLKFDLSGGIPEGTYQYQVTTERNKNGTIYNLDKSEFCTNQTTFTVGTKVCVVPPPSTDPVKCCPTQPQGSSWTTPISSFFSSIAGIVGSAPFRVKLGIKKMETTTDVKYVADYLFGKDLSGQIDTSTPYFSALPPYQAAAQYPTDTEKTSKRRETAQYSFNFNNDGGTELNKGPINDIAPAAEAAAQLQAQLMAPPIRDEDRPVSQKGTESNAAFNSPSDGKSGEVLGSSTPICTDVQSSYKSEDNVCYSESESQPLNFNEFVSLIQNSGLNGAVSLLLEKTDWLSRYVTGADTSSVDGEDSAYKRNNNYFGGGLNSFFSQPGEEAPVQIAGDASGDFTLGFQYKSPLTNNWEWVPGLKIDLPWAQLSMKGIATVRNVIDQKLIASGLQPGESPPQRELPPQTLPPEPVTIPPVTPPATFSGTCTLCNQTFASTQALKDLLDQVGNTMKVPASVLTGMLRFEGGNFATSSSPYPYNHIFKYPDDLIQQISVSGGRDPNCAQSSAGAVGPCQFMDSAWSTYGNTIKTIVGDPNYTPDRCNLRDCLYATAAKMKHDAVDNPPMTLGQGCGGYTTTATLPADSCNWTLGNVAAAGYHYYGNCTANYSTTLVNYYLNKSCQP